MLREERRAPDRFLEQQAFLFERERSAPCRTESFMHVVQGDSRVGAFKETAALLEVDEAIGIPWNPSCTRHVRSTRVASAHSSRLPLQRSSSGRNSVRQGRRPIYEFLKDMGKRDVPSTFRASR